MFICGLCTDICVGKTKQADIIWFEIKLYLAWTAYHALELGFRTVLIEDACRGISDEGIKETFKKIKEENGLVVKSSEVKKKL